MNILITMNKIPERDYYFPDDAVYELRKIGNVKFNVSVNPFSEDDLKENIRDIDICLTHWGCPRFTDEVLKNAGKLKLIAHAAGTVAGFIGKEVYDREIVVCSANNVMALFVAEGTLAYILSALRSIPMHDKSMKNKEWPLYEAFSLYNQKVGLIGLGSVGRWLLELLKPFHVYVKIFDPYVNIQSLAEYSNVEKGSLEDVLSWANIISVHAARTPETYHMLNRERLSLVRDGAFLINTARGAIIDEEALINELKTGRLSAVLDVFEIEPLPADSPLREMQNVILMPHRAGCGIHAEMTYAMIDEIKRFLEEKPLKYQIPYEVCELMTR